jgi:hypothetical protein
LEILDTQGFRLYRASVQRRAHTRNFGNRVTRWGGTMRARQGLVALAALFTTSLGLADDAGLSIETGSPDALCPELASTRAAVSRRLGALRLPDGSSGYRARYTIGHAPVGSPRDFVRLELFGPEGTLQLARDLPLEGESCSTMAEVIALVLDRYFSALFAGEPEEDEGQKELGPEPVAAPSRAATPSAPIGSPLAPSAPVPAATSSAESSPTLATATGPTRLSLVAFELAFRNPVQPAVGARVMTEPWSTLYLGAALHIGLMSDSEDVAGGGEVSSRDATLRAYIAWGPRLGPVRTYIGPGFRFGISRGSGHDLPTRDVGYRASGAAGLDAGAIWVTNEGWSFGASAALDISFAELSGRFTIDGEEVLALDPLRGWVGMAVGHDF